MAADRSRDWSGLLAFIQRGAATVLVFEPDRTQLDSIRAAFVAAGHTVQTYATIAEAEEIPAPTVADYSFLNVAFGQSEKPDETWSDSEFFEALAINMHPGNVMTYYTIDIERKPSRLQRLLAPLAKSGAGSAETLLRLPASPLVRHGLRMLWNQTILELALYVTVAFFAVWGTASGSPTLVLISGLLGATLISYSVDELLTAFYRRTTPNTPHAPEVVRVRRGAEESTLAIVKWH